MSPPIPRLLIVDDDATFLSVLARALARQGFDVSTAETPEEALSRSAEVRPEGILLDLNLDGRSGLNLIAPLREQLPAARIVILTGYASIQTTVLAMRQGANHYLPKPADVGDIVQALRGDLTLPEDAPALDQLSVQHLEWEYIQRKLAQYGGNISATARALKMHRRTLQRKLAKRRPVDTGLNGD